MKDIQQLATDYCKEKNLDVSHWEHAKEYFIAGFRMAVGNNIFYRAVPFKDQLPNVPSWYFVIDRWGTYSLEYLNYQTDYPKNNLNPDLKYWLIEYHNPIKQTT